MMRELLDSVRSTLYERVTSPFAGVFVLSWVALNWQLLAVLFLGEGDIFTRIAFVQDAAGGAPSLLWYPLGLTIAVIAVYPLAAVLPFAWWQLGARWRANLKKRIEKKQLLTLEQANKLRADIARAEAEYRRGIEEKEQEAESYQSQLKELADSEASVRQELEEANARIARLVDEGDTDKDRPSPPSALRTPSREKAKGTAQSLIARVEQDRPETSFTISSAEDFIDSIGSNRTLRLVGEEFLLSNHEGYGDNSHVEWPSVHDGSNLVIRGVENLHIVSDRPVAPRVLVTPAYAWVFEFHESARVAVANVELGHVTPGTCVGGVLKAVNCHDFRLADCVLFGSGTEGVTLDDCRRFEFEDVQVRGCTYHIMTLAGSKHVLFSNCSFKKNKGFDMINVKDCHEIDIVSSEISDNLSSRSEHSAASENALFNIQVGSAVRIRDSRILRNTARYFERFEGTVMLLGTAVSQNDIKERFERATFQL